jgi:hypothetical protein
MEHHHDTKKKKRFPRTAPNKMDTEIDAQNAATTAVVFPILVQTSKISFHPVCQQLFNHRHVLYDECHKNADLSGFRRKTEPRLACKLSELQRIAIFYIEVKLRGCLSTYIVFGW